MDVKAGGTTVWAWTGDSGDEVEDGGEGLASVNLTAVAPVAADSAKVSTDIAEGATRVPFGSTVTVTIQLVGAADADAVRDAGGNSYTVSILRVNETDQDADGTPAAVTDSDASGKSTQVLKVDASGKATFTITASDPDGTDKNNPDADSSASPPVVGKIDRTRVTFTVETTTGGQAVDDDISSTTGGSQTITFSDARPKLTGASVKPATDFLTRPMSGSANNVVTVTVVDQYGGPIRGHLVRLSSAHVPAGSPANASKFPVPRRTDSSGSVRIGYTYTGGASVETLQVNTAANDTDSADLTPIADATADFYWVAPAGTTGASGAVLVSDADRNTIIVASSSDGPQLVRYDDNDQYVIETEFTSMAAFEETLAEDEDNNDTVVVSSYDPDDASDVARLVLTVVADS